MGKDILPHKGLKKALEKKLEALSYYRAKKYN